MAYKIPIVNLFDSFDVPVNESYLDKFFDVIADDIDFIEPIRFVYDVDPQVMDETLIIDIEKETIRTTKQKRLLNIITPKKILVRHEFLKYPLLAIYTSLNGNRSIMSKILKHFYFYMYDAILSSVIETHMYDNINYVSEIDVHLLELYGYSLHNISAGGCS